MSPYTYVHTCLWVFPFVPLVWFFCSYNCVLVKFYWLFKIFICGRHWRSTFFSDFRKPLQKLHWQHKIAGRMMVKLVLRINWWKWRVKKHAKKLWLDGTYSWRKWNRKEKGAEKEKKSKQPTITWGGWVEFAEEFKLCKIRNHWWTISEKQWSKRSTWHDKNINFSWGILAGFWENDNSSSIKSKSKSLCKNRQNNEIIKSKIPQTTFTAKLGDKVSP